MTMEAEPRALELTGEDLHKAVHAYGTNEIITEVEMPLTAHYDWADVIVGFDCFDAAAAYALALGEQDGILKKLMTVVAGPTPHDCFLRHRALIPPGASVVILMIAPHSLDAFEAFTRPYRDARILLDSSHAAPETLAGLPPNYELTWNHTTLRALRVDPRVTYLQVRYPTDGGLKLIKRIHDLYGRRGQGTPRAHPLQRPDRLRRPAAGRVHHRSAAPGDHRRARSDGRDDLQSPPLHPRGGRHEADRRDPARLQARDRSPRACSIRAR